MVKVTGSVSGIFLKSCLLQLIKNVQNTLFPHQGMVFTGQLLTRIYPFPVFSRPFLNPMFRPLDEMTDCRFSNVDFSMFDIEYRAIDNRTIQDSSSLRRQESLTICHPFGIELDVSDWNLFGIWDFRSWNLPAGRVSTFAGMTMAFLAPVLSQWKLSSCSCC